MTINSAQKILVLGLGKTGLSCARFLHNKGCQVAVADTREAPPLAATLRESLPDLPVFLGELNLGLLDQVDEIVISPGIDPRIEFVVEAKKREISVFSEIEIFARHVKGRVIGITGTNGKSTVTQLVGLMAKAANIKCVIGGNFGTPALDLLADEPQDLYVLELSSFQLEETNSLNLEVAAVLNITEDHMDRYDHYDDYVAAKKRILMHANYRVLNADDEQLLEWAGEPGSTAFYSVANHAAPYTLRLKQKSFGLMINGDEFIDSSDLKLVGVHNYSNALAAIAIAQLAGVNVDAIRSTLPRFTGLPHRMQWVAEHGGVTYINDSKATNVGATLAALSGATSPVILIAGGVGKDQDFSPLAAALDENIRHVVLFGEAANVIGDIIPDGVSVSHVASLKLAVAAAAAQAEPGDVVLFSPACASFDMFGNFEERGAAFMQLAQQVAA